MKLNFEKQADHIRPVMAYESQQAEVGPILGDFLWGKRWDLCDTTGQMWSACFLE